MFGARFRRGSHVVRVATPARRGTSTRVNSSREIQSIALTEAASREHVRQGYICVCVPDYVA